MDDNIADHEIARRSALVYLPMAVGATLLFLLAASVFGNYPFTRLKLGAMTRAQVDEYVGEILK